MHYDTSKLTPTVAEREEALKLYQVFEDAEKAYGAAVDKPESEVTHEELGRLLRARNAAEEAWQNHPVTLEFDEDGELLRCSLSGLPTTDDDELLEDEDTGECVLRALVLPSRSQTVEIADEPVADAA